LRERTEDIPPLAKTFVARFAAEMGKAGLGLSASALDLLSRYPFPGNVRELENAVERAVILGDGAELDARDFSFAGANMNPPPALPPSVAAAPDVGVLSLRELEQRAIEAALLRNGGHREQSAQDLGITRRTLLNKMKEFGLQ
jgi:two-component system response regulator AtoC